MEQLHVFERHQRSFITAMSQLGQSDLNTIRHIGSVERALSRAWKSFKGAISTPDGVSLTKSGKSVLFKLLTPSKTVSYSQLTWTADRDSSPLKFKPQYDAYVQVLRDQNEYIRRKAEEDKINSLSGSARRMAVEAEDDRIRQYDEQNTLYASEIKPYRIENGFPIV